jgi:RNA polymerase sigma-70 factor (ECF subfamily)
VQTLNDSQNESPIDERLLARLRSREPDALPDLYDRFCTIIYSVIYRIVGEHHSAEDLTQETFFKVWTHIHLYDPGIASLRSWMIVIARNRAIDHIRAFRRCPPICSFESDRLEQLPSAASEHSRHSYGENFPDVSAAFLKLTENQRTVLHLAYFRGLTQTQIASELDQPLGTIKTWARTALGSIRQEVERSIACGPRPDLSYRVASGHAESTGRTASGAANG